MKVKMRYLVVMLIVAILYLISTAYHIANLHQRLGNIEHFLCHGGFGGRAH